MKMIRTESIHSAFDVVAKKLSRFLRAEVAAKFEGARLVEPNSLLENLGGPGAEIIGVLLHVSGGFDAELLFYFPPHEAENLALRLSGKGLDSEIGDSALNETTNILASAWLSAIGEAEGLRLLPSPPAKCRDFAGPIIEEILAIRLERKGTFEICDAELSVDGEPLAVRALLVMGEGEV